MRHVVTKYHECRCGDDHSANLENGWCECRDEKCDNVHVSWMLANPEVEVKQDGKSYDIDVHHHEKPLDNDPFANVQ